MIARHLVALGAIVVMEFGLGVTLLIVRKTATMMYSAIKLWYRIREAPKIIETSSVDIAAQNVQMRSVGTPLPSSSASFHPVFSPSLNYLPNRRHPVFATNSPFSRYPSHLESMKPPQYDSLSPDLQHPPTYMEVVPGALTNRASRTDEMDRRPASCNSV
ncbi:hypothetical protein AVEN_88641-1 [Araneus ventricosus]|uniref:Uncharacterized protein n=1 Tax=Araneus ventricosus TaxID=182803 RepID=A0A4Y2PAC0_ARAVE|nr:hypothetical protein AVEN_88641-1 [Araneus ventricosus]